MGACGNSATCGLTGLLAVDVPLDGRGPTALPAAEMMSPVFTLWITLVAMYLGAALAGDVTPACAFRELCFLLLMRAHRECESNDKARMWLCIGLCHCQLGTQLAHHLSAAFASTYGPASTLLPGAKLGQRAPARIAPAVVKSAVWSTALGVLQAEVI